MKLKDKFTLDSLLLNSEYFNIYSFQPVFIHLKFLISITKFSDYQYPLPFFPLNERRVFQCKELFPAYNLK